MAKIRSVVETLATIVAATLLAGATLAVGLALGQRRGASLGDRVKELERGQDRWRTELAALADAAEDILQRAERRVKRAEAAERRDATESQSQSAEQSPPAMTDAQAREDYRQRMKLHALGSRDLGRQPI